VVEGQSFEQKPYPLLCLNYSVNGWVSTHFVFYFTSLLTIGRTVPTVFENKDKRNIEKIIFMRVIVRAEELLHSKYRNIPLNFILLFYQDFVFSKFIYSHSIVTQNKTLAT